MGLTGSGEGLRWPDKFYVRLNSLAYGIGQSDFPPTTQQLEVHAKFTKQLAEYKIRFNKIIKEDLEAFNQLLKEKNIRNIISTLH